MTISSYQRARFLLTVASTASFALCWFAGAAFGIPAYTKFDVSLLNQPSPAIALFITLVLTVACALIGSAIAGTVRFEAGLATAAIGLLALTMRGGPMRYTLFYGTGPQVFLTLTAELMILYAILGIGWGVVWLLRNNGWLRDDPFRDGVADVNEPMSQKLSALATQAIVMALIMMLLCKTDRKPQVLASVFLGSFLATLAAHSRCPKQPWNSTSSLRARTMWRRFERTMRRARAVIWARCCAKSSNISTAAPRWPSTRTFERSGPNSMSSNWRRCVSRAAGSEARRSRWACSRCSSSAG
jgi:hypothetical protein